MSNTRLSVITAHPSSEEVSILRRSLFMNAGKEEMEIVVTVGAESIAKAYNAGAAKAQGETFLFTHSDVEILTSRAMLGGAIHDLQRKESGVLGIAGTRVLQDTAVWWDSSIKRELSGACMHTDKNTTWMTTFGHYGRVVVLDGVFLMMRREVFEKVGPFDEDFPGWDYYDIDFTLRVHLAGFINSTYPLHILHHSLGNRINNEGWKKNRAQFQKKWTEILPVAL